MLCRALSAWILTAAAIVPARVSAQARLGPAEHAAIAAEVDRMAATARRAWTTRDAKLLVPDSTLAADQLRADVQRRMNVTVRVDTLVEVLDSVRSVTRDSILAYSSQRFVRLMRLESGVERVRISAVIHERSFVRSAGRWRTTGTAREIAPRAMWADETPAGIAAAVDSVRALDSAWARSYATHDTALAAAVFSDRLFMTSSDGRVKDKAMEMGDVRPSADLKMEYFRTTDVRVETFAGAGVVMGVAEWAFTYRGQRSEWRRRYAAVYVRGGPLGWQMASLHMGPPPAN